MGASRPRARHHPDVEHPWRRGQDQRPRARGPPSSITNAEAQADWFADTILAGTPACAARLRRWPVARRPVLRSSPGHGLATTLRARVESLTGVDLAPVRVHVDPSAARLAELRGAQAFTAGTHIYFGAGSFRPHTRAGLHLLVHELAHVIQQTGALDFAGSVRLASRHGSAAPQHRDVLGMRTPPTSEVVAFYLARFAGMQPLIDEVERWRDEAAKGKEPWTTTDTALRPITAKVRKYEHLRPGPRRESLRAEIIRENAAIVRSVVDPRIGSFYVDFLKASGKTAEAARWLIAFSELPTMFLQRATLESFVALLDGSIVNMAQVMWRHDPLFADARPAKVAALVRGYFLGPGRINPGIKAEGMWLRDHPKIGKGLRETKEALPVAHPPTSRLLPNELRWGPIQAIYHVNRFRIDFISQLHAWVTKSGETPLPEKMRNWIYGHLELWRKKFELDDPKYSPPKHRHTQKWAMAWGFAHFMARGDLATLPGMRRESAQLLAREARPLALATLPAITVWKAVLDINPDKPIAWEAEGQTIFYFDPISNTKTPLPFSVREVFDIMRAGDTKSFVTFRRYLVKGLARRVFARRRGKLPSIRRYAGIVHTEKALARNAAYTAFESRNSLLIASHEDLLANPAVLKEIVANSWFLAGVEELKQVLGSYESKGDTAKGTKARNQAKARELAAAPQTFTPPAPPGFKTLGPYYQHERAGDLRLVHRSKVAEWLWSVGNHFGWDDLILASKTLHGHAAQTSFDLALVSDWTWEPGVDLSTIREDFPRSARSYVKDGATIRLHDGLTRYGPMTIRHIYAVFKEMQHRKEAGKIRQLVGLARGSAAVPKTAILNQANTWMKSTFTRPQRAIMSDARIEYNAKIAKQYAKALAAHPKTVDFIDNTDAGKGSKGYIFFAIPELPPPRLPLVMWGIPDQRDVVTSLRADSELADWVWTWHFGRAASKLPSLEPGVDYEKGDTEFEATIAEVMFLHISPPSRTNYNDTTIVSDEVWYTLLKLAIKGSTDKKLGLAKEPHEILGRLEKRQHEAIVDAHADLKLAQRQATSIERNRRTQGLIEALDLYATGGTGLKRIEVAGKGQVFRGDMDALAYGWMLDFLPGVRPSDDQLLHRAAWMFELMDVKSSTRKRLRRSDSHFLVRDYSKWTALALEYYNNGDKRKLLLSVLTDRNGKGERLFTPAPDKTATQNARDRRAAREAYLSKQAARVHKLDVAFAKQIDEWHKERGMWATVGTDTDPGEVGRVGGARTWKVRQDEFFWGGPTPWRVLAVFNEFTYHPAVFPEATILDPSNPRRYRGLSVVKVKGHTFTSAHRSAKGHQPVKLMLVAHGNFTKLVTTADELWLREFSHAVTMSLIHSGPAAFLDAMKEIGNFILEVVEFIPGVGQGVALARTGYQIIDFIASGEFVDLIEAMTEDPIEKIKDALATWKARLSWSELVVFLLLGSSAGPKGRFKRPKKHKPRKITRRGSGRLRRMAYTLMNVGLGIYRAIARVRRRIQEAVFGVQLEIAERPMLRRLLLLLASRWSVLSTIGAAMLRDLGRVSPAELGARVQASLQSVIDRIAGFQIPRTIIDMETIVGIVLEFIASRLRGKKGVILKVAIRALEAIGQWKHVERAIAAPFKRIEPIINAGWSEIVDQFGPPMEAGRSKLIEGFNAALGQLSGLPGFSAKIEKPGAPLMQITETNEEGEEVAAQLPRMDLKQKPVDMFSGPVPLPKLRSGKPIPGDIKAEVEEQMYQHFSDVELHVSGTGDALLKSLGAKGATVDTHVILSSNLQISSGEGRDILMHELGHVTQNRSAPKSGPKPPAAKPAPIQVGIRNDPTLEAHADAIVRLAKDRGIREPLKIKTSRRGLRLDTGVIPRFLGALGGDEHIRSFRETLDEDAPAGLAQLTPSTIRAIEHVWTGIEKLLRGRFTATRPFVYERALIRGHILDNTAVKTDIKAAIDRIGRRVQKPQNPASSATNPKMWLDAGLFMTELRRYIYGRTGVLVDVGEKVLDIRVKRGKKTKKLPALDPNTPVRKLAVRFVNPGLLSAASKLYKEPVAASFRGRMRDETGRWVKEDDAHRRALRVQLSAYARSSDGPGMWSRGGLKFKTTVVKEIRRRTEEKLANKRVPSKLPASSIPTWSSYRATSQGKVDSVHGSVGLRVSKYETKHKKHTADSQWGTERESHHITQFLLAEYFAHGTDGKQNSASKCAFKHLRSQTDKALYPFLDVENNMPKTIHNARKDIPIAALAAGRGGAMPAILLARSTHRAGSLHVSTAASDYGDDVSTQSQVVDAEYRRALGAHHADFAGAEAGTKAEFVTYMTQGEGAKADVREKIQAAVQGAIQHTYRWMRKHMQGRLLPALLEHERNYYQTLAKAREVGTSDEELELIHDEATIAKTKGYDVERAKMATDLNTVATTAKDENDKGLAAYGLFVA